MVEQLKPRFRRVSLSIGFDAKFLTSKGKKHISWISFCREILAGHIRDAFLFHKCNLDLSPKAENSILFARDEGSLYAMRKDWNAEFLEKAKTSLNAFVGIVSTILFNDKEEYIRRQRIKKKYIRLVKKRDRLLLRYDLVSQRMYYSNPIFSLIMLMAIVGISAAYSNVLIEDLKSRIDPDEIEQVIIEGNRERAKEIWKQQIRPLFRRWGAGLVRVQIRQFVDNITDGIEKLIDKNCISKYWTKSVSTFGILSFTNSLKRHSEINEESIKELFECIIGR